MRRNASRSFDTCEETGVTKVVYLPFGQRLVQEVWHEGDGVRRQLREATASDLNRACSASGRAVGPIHWFNASVPLDPAVIARGTIPTV
jgi:hypothetical protein